MIFLLFVPPVVFALAMASTRAGTKRLWIAGMVGTVAAQLIAALFAPASPFSATIELFLLSLLLPWALVAVLLALLKFPERHASETSGSRRSRRVWTTAIVATVTAFGIYGYQKIFGPAVYEKPGLRFTAKHCGESIETPTTIGPGGARIPGTPAEGIRTQTWRADGTLFLDAVLIENCARRPNQGDYTMKGNAIALSYTVARTDAVTACNCAFRVTYEIGGLPRADYQIIFPRTGMQVP